MPMGVTFSAPTHTGPGTKPASYSMGKKSLPGVKRSGNGSDHPPPPTAQFKERINLYLYFPSGPSWSVIWQTLKLPPLKTCLAK